MTFRFKEDPLFTHAVTWAFHNNPEVKMFNYHEPQASFDHHFPDFEAKFSLLAPQGKTKIVTDYYILEIRWQIHEYGRKSFVSWYQANFELKEPGMKLPALLNFPKIYDPRNDKDWIELYRLLTRLWKHRGLLSSYSQYFTDKNINSLNATLNSVRFEILFGKKWSTCVGCSQLFDPFQSSDTLCPDCCEAFHSEEEEDEISSELSPFKN
jgi:hypothetical protein